MSAAQRFKGRFRRKHGSSSHAHGAASLTAEETQVDLGERVPLDVLLSAVRLLPHSATVFIEGTTIAPEVQAFLEAHRREPGRDDLSGVVWPRSEQFHLQHSDALVDGIRELASRHAVPELVDHLVVYEGDDIFLAAYDAGDDPVTISRALPDETKRRIRELVAD